MLKAKWASTICYVCRDSTSHILFIGGKISRDHHIPVTKILAIRKVIVTIIQKQLTDVIIESDSLVAVKAINGISPLIKLGH